MAQFLELLEEEKPVSTYSGIAREVYADKNAPYMKVPDEAMTAFARHGYVDDPLAESVVGGPGKDIQVGLMETDSSLAALGSESPTKQLIADELSHIALPFGDLYGLQDPRNQKFVSTKGGGVHSANHEAMHAAIAKLKEDPMFEMAVSSILSGSGHQEHGTIVPLSVQFTGEHATSKEDFGDKEEFMKESSVALNRAPEIKQKDDGTYYIDEEEAVKTGFLAPFEDLREKKLTPEERARNKEFRKRRRAVLIEQLAQLKLAKDRPGGPR